MDYDSETGIIPWAKVNLPDDDSQARAAPPCFAFSPGDTRAEMTIPLKYDNKVLVFSTCKVILMLFLKTIASYEALADNVASAIHNADLFRSGWRRQVADGLRDVAGLISSEADLADVLESVLLELERNLPCEASVIWLLDGENLFAAQAHGVQLDEVEGAIGRWPEAYGFLVAALEAQEPVVRKPDDPIGPTGTALGFSADYSSIAVGLRAGGMPLGVLTLSHHTSGRYGHEARAMAAAFANHAAVAIQNARLYDSVQEQAYASAALLQIAQAISNSNNLDDIIRVSYVTPMLVGGLCDLFAE
jgi:transcriptional regulator with GAF, ATPase, and Fis domain